MRPDCFKSPRTLLLTYLLALPLIALIAASVFDHADAHIIPPEKYHPAAEAYRRMNFLLNLNPVPWSQVRRDALTIAKELGDEDKAASEAYRNEVEALISACNKDKGASQRKAAARSIFEISTRAVARTMILCLQSAQSSLSDRDRAEKELKEARQIWACFEHEVKATDPAGFATIGQAFLDATSGMGTSGVLGSGVVPIDRDRVTANASKVAAYVTENFVSYKAGSEDWLVAVPRNSATFDSNARVPMKLPPGADINKQVPRPRQILNMAARGVDESETPLIALGDMAFDSAHIFGEPARSLGITCNTCHNKGVTNPNFVIPGLSARPGGMDVSNSFFEPQANNGHFGHLDTPDLRGIRFTAPYGRNGRTASLREFVRNVIVLEFNGPEPDPMLVDGMVAYMNEFDFLPNANINSDGSLRPKASAAALRGEKIFNTSFKQMGNRACASCHIPSDQFLDRKRHDIGTVSGTEPFSLDRALDTPTLLGVKYTQPYFHDGSQPTLRAVNEWFNKKYHLGLTKQQIDDLTAYVEAIGDGKDAYEDSPYYLASEMEEFSFFLSAYEFLKSQKKWNLIDATFETVATEIRNHKWELQDLSQVPVMDRLAELIDEARAALAKGDYSAVDRSVAEYRTYYAANESKLQ